MNSNKTNTFKAVAFTHFVPCFFLGVISLFFVKALAPGIHFESLIAHRIDPMDILVGTGNGLLVAFLVVCFHILRNRNIRHGKAWFRAPADARTFTYGSLIGFLGGSFDILFGLHNEGILLMTVIVLVILVWHLKVFTRTIKKMLRPGNHATWDEVGELLRIYLNMLAGFTLLNASLEVAHVLTDTATPFQYGVAEGQLFLNSLYYTVVTMTTLGFGDIVPHTWDGKLLLIFQCMVSYVMFALMIGIITRGVVTARDTDDI